MKKSNKYKIQVSKQHYLSSDYGSKERWISYWYQIKEILDTKPRRVLEVGVGNKTVSDYLKRIGLNVTTCDFDSTLNPDVIASVLDLPFKDNKFDTVLCAEVLEHLEFKDFVKALKELRRVSSKWIIITIPHISATHFYIGFKTMPFISKKEILINVDFPLKHHFEGEHYWEIGKKGYHIDKIQKYFKKANLFLEKSYRPIENPAHHFFTLSKYK